MKNEPTNSTAAREVNLHARRPTRLPSGSAWAPFERHHSYDADLAAAPDVRLSAVVRGRALIANPDYPAKEQLRRIARVLLTAGLVR